MYQIHLCYPVYTEEKDVGGRLGIDASNMIHHIRLPSWIARHFALRSVLFDKFSGASHRQVVLSLDLRIRDSLSAIPRPHQATMPMVFNGSFLKPIQTPPPSSDNLLLV